MKKFPPRTHLNIHSDTLEQNYWNLDSIFDDGSTLYHGGKNKSPHLTWDKVKGAKSYVVKITDYEAANLIGTPFIHWVVANLETNELEFDAASRSDLHQGYNSFSSPSLMHISDRSLAKANALANATYVGPNASDTSHNYEIIVYAIKDKSLDLPKPFYWADLHQAMENKIVAWDSISVKLRHPSDNVNHLYKDLFKDRRNLKYIDIISNNVDKKGFLDSQYAYSPYAPNPNLDWTHVEGANYYSLIMLDNESRHSTGGLPFIHWLVANINVNSLEANATATNKEILHGDTSASREYESKYLINNEAFMAPFIPDKFLLDGAATRYLGPNPQDAEHRYTVIIYAHENKLNLIKGFKLGSMSRALHGNVLGEGIFEFKVKKQVK
ncbi:YbhB/YbcL family Raf kinase inhibitor-like protein [Mycoplasmopsis agassizii]|uniref:Phospholipid-binding protein n=1 Tax=Mycoplasmopsis agassizii TaxID=33922 RepID=A0ABX4H6E5_9BACT|nr:YbhB/YbcL family Raf kinase inhibitor-like protein [Mycoplasmopsis agassizii]PAF55441.1 hypothetical protein CJF60_02025 [Mycoplasmopsis agassizii]SMC18436.1 Raf kinase inhibitor-like protein, YbhB/YbcL family [Mycoplasmopsis agassizii]